MLIKIIIPNRRCVAQGIGIQKKERSIPGGKIRLGFLDEADFEPDFNE